MKTFWLFLSLVCAATCPAQVDDSQPYVPDLQSAVPRAYVVGTVDLNGGGYSMFDLAGGGGVRIDARHFLFNAQASADNAKKDGDKTGHDLYAEANAFYRFSSGCYAGGGFLWSEDVTPSYVKAQKRPTFGGGKDVLWERFSARLQTLYVMAGTDKINDLHGLDFSLWIPSPALKGHFFFYEDLGIYRFHGSFDPPDKHTTSFLSFGVMARF